MQEESHTIVAGIVIAIIVLLIAAFFIFFLVAYANNRKKKFLHEKESMQRSFKEQLLLSRLEMQEQTFNMISKEIHDNVGQILSLAKVQVNIMEHQKEFDAMLLDDLKISVDKAMLDLRDIARGLNSDRVDMCSLEELTREELQRIGRLGLIKTTLFTEGQERNPVAQKRLIIFRIIQESLHNILKHAEAKNILVFLYYNDNYLKCDIKDDGIGFDQGVSHSQRGLGLQNMIDRASMIGGEITISSVVGEGTNITIKSQYA